MSNNSRSDSEGSQKSIFGHFQSAKGSHSDASEMFKKGLRNITDRTRNVGAAIQSNLQNAINSKREASVYSKASRELDEYGYEKYNIDDEVEIFISKVPERALFNDGEPVIVRANDESFIGTAVAEPKPAPVQATVSNVDVDALFSNVPTGRRGEETIAGYTGTVVGGELQAVAVSEAAEVSADFFEEAEAASSVPEQAVPADETEDLRIVSFEEGSDIVIIDSSEVADGSADVPEPMAVVAAADVVQADVQDDAADAVSEDAGAPEAETVLQDEDAADDEAGTVQVSEPVAASVQEQAADDMPVSETVVAGMATFREAPSEDAGEFAGLYTEAKEAISEAATVDETVKVASAPMAETSEAIESKAAVSEPVAAIKGMDEEGVNILPPLTQTVRQRPRTVRFRFHNGVLQNVDDSKAESDEGLRGPFDVTVGQTVSRATGFVCRMPVKIADEADLMPLTVPGLDIEEDAYSVGPTDDTIPDDGLEALAFALPPVAIDDEVADIMAMTVPGLDVQTDGIWDYAEIPEDGLEAMCFESEPVYSPACVGIGVGYPALAAAATVHSICPPVAVQAISAPAEVQAISAPAEVQAISAPAKVHSLPAPATVHAIASPAEVACLPAAPAEVCDEPETEPETAAHGVVFGFGNGSGCGSVCFSF